MAIFNRVKTCTVEQPADGIFEVKSTFIDSFHEINLTIQVDYKLMEIISASACMVRVPHPDCRVAESQAGNLAGIKIAHGARKAILGAVGHAHGCTHIADLALDAVKAAIQANFKIQARELSQEERTAKLYEQLAGTCHYWTNVEEQVKGKVENTGE